MIVNYIGFGAGAAGLIFMNSKKGKELISSDKARLVITIVSAAASVFFAWKESKNITNYFRNKKFASELTNGNQTQVEGTTTTTGGAPVQVDLKTIAAKIHSAFYDNDWFGASEDEEAAIAALMEIQPTDAARLAVIYNGLYAKILKEDFIKYLSVSQANGINSYLNVM